MADFTVGQAAAIHTLDVNIAVSAGAGAGKTKVLVERYINILRQRQASCSEILAITFTNKAAKEMKERIRAKALELAADNTEDKQLWRNSIEELEYASIGTFHSFCARLLRENPVESGIDPGFAVLDETEAAILIEKTLAEVLERAVSLDNDWLDALLSVYEKRTIVDNLPDLYEQVDGQGLLTDDLPEQFSAPYRLALAEEEKIKERLRLLINELIGLKVELKPKTLNYVSIDKLETQWPEVDAAINAIGTGDKACYLVLHGYLDSLDRRTAKTKELVTDIKNTLAELDRLQVDRQSLTVIPAWCCLLTSFDLALNQHKREQRLLTFSDLEVASVSLLKNNPDICTKYVNRVKFLMVDEFQDTNELQRQLVYLLAGGDADILSGKKLFIVGDAKQSIYRFRGADVNIFERVKADIVAGGGQTIDLAINFRSMDGLLALYNEVFTLIMGTAEDRIAFQPLQAHRCAAATSQTRAELLIIDKEHISEDISGRQAEALAIARRIRLMVAGREKLIDHDKMARPVSFGDIAILFRTFKDIQHYASALQQNGVPFYIVGGNGFFECQEIQDVLNILRIVDNRFQETAMAAVLRSPLFMLDDVALALLKSGGGSLWQGLEDPRRIAALSENQRLAADRCRDLLDKLRNLRNMVTVDALIKTALQETGYLDFVLTQFMGQQKYANLLKLVGLVNKYKTRSIVSLSDFLRYVDTMVAGDVKEAEAVIESEDGDTVKLMTIHKAKGLEYPVVFLPDLHRNFNEDNTPILFSPKIGLGLKVPIADKLAASSLYVKMVEEEKLLARLELKRLLYVAFTRAKDYIVLSGSDSKFADNKALGELKSWLGWLGKICGLSDLAQLSGTISIGQTEIRVSCGMPEAFAGTCLEDTQYRRNVEKAELGTILRNIGKLTDLTNKKMIFSASKVDKFYQCQRAYYYSYIAGLPDLPEVIKGSGSGSPPASLTGTVLHRCLEIFDTANSWRETLLKVIDERVQPRWRDIVFREAAPLLEHYANSNFFRELFKKAIYKEWQFNYFLPEPDGVSDGYYFTGSVDCLVDYGSSLRIIDYKTDKVSGVQAPVKAEEHKLQLLLYSLAVESIFKKPVYSADIYFWRPDVAVSLVVDGMEKKNATAQLLSFCRYVTDHQNESDYNCRTERCGSCGFNSFCPKS